MATLKSVEALLAKPGAIAVFSKSYCPYCSKAKSILSSYAAVKPRIQVLELDLMGQPGPKIQDFLAKKLGKNRITVPQIFIGGQHVGGCDDLQTAQSTGKLEEMLEDIMKTEVPAQEEIPNGKD